MTYELAKQKDTYFKFDDKWYVAPTLSELIEACGDDFVSMGKMENGTWYATTSINENRGGHIIGYYATPEEAIVNLWLFLNKK